MILFDVSIKPEQEGIALHFQQFGSFVSFYNLT